mgnify:CR=1 FL=1
MGTYRDSQNSLSFLDDGEVANWSAELEKNRRDVLREKEKAKKKKREREKEKGKKKKKKKRELLSSDIGDEEDIASGKGQKGKKRRRSEACPDEENDNSSPSRKKKRRKLKEKETKKKKKKKKKETGGPVQLSSHLYGDSESDGSGMDSLTDFESGDEKAPLSMLMKETTPLEGKILFEYEKRTISGIPTPLGIVVSNREKNPSRALATVIGKSDSKWDVKDNGEKDLQRGEGKGGRCRWDVKA